MKNLPFFTLTLLALVVMISAKIPLHRDEFDDYEYNTEYSDTMREKYRNYCLKNLEKSYSTWKIL